jgi:hypothetical protein
MEIDFSSMAKYLFLLLCIPLIFQSCSTKGNGESSGIDSTEIVVLKTFYSLYIEENAKNQIDEKAVSSLKRKYVTPELLKKIDNAELDYDPFLMAQDCDERWINTLTIIPKNVHEYTLCYSFSKGKQNCITLQLVKNENGYQITDIKGLEGNSDIRKEVDNSQNQSAIDGKWMLLCGDEEKASIEFLDSTSAYLNLYVTNNSLARLLVYVKCINEKAFVVRYGGLTGITRGNTDLKW